MNEETTFPAGEAWTDETGTDEQSFGERVEAIRERRDRDENSEDDGEESLDAAVERLSGRVYRVRYPDPADASQINRETIVADNIKPTAAGMAFAKNGGERVRVYPAPVDLKRLDDDDVVSWYKSKRRKVELLKPFANLFSGGND